MSRKSVFYVMYISGTQFDFENRLHALTTSESIFNSFYSEKLNYTVESGVEMKWYREFEMKKYQLQLTGYPI